tara:strand:- start:2945 stop:4675 length:1731 start_codon:yes stop_codon:yes gene_type:complete
MTVYFGRQFPSGNIFNSFYEYQWDFGDGTVKSFPYRSRKIKHTYTQAGWYTVKRIVIGRDPAGNVACSDTFSRSIYAGGLIGLNCNMQINSADTIFNQWYLISDSSQTNTTVPALNYLFFNFGGYEFPTKVNSNSASTLHIGGTAGGTAPNLGINRACIGRQLYLASNPDSLISECLSCKDVFVSSSYSLAINDLTQVNPLTGEVNFQAQGSATPTLSNGLTEYYYWVIRPLGPSFKGQNYNALMPRPGKYFYERVYGVSDTSGNPIAQVTEWDSITIPQANTCKARFESTQRSTKSPDYKIQFNNRSSNLFSNSSTSNFRWYFGDGDSSVTESPLKTYTQPGNYQVVLIHHVLDNLGSLICSDTAREMVNVAMDSLQCQASFRVIDSLSVNFNLIVRNNTVSVVNDTNYSTSYLWDFGDGQTSTAPYPQHTYAVNGAYELCLDIVVTDNRSSLTCTSSFCDTVGIDSLGNVIFKTNQGFSLNVINPATISSEERVVAINNWEVYPNPASDQLRIANLDFSMAKVQVRLLDIRGRIVLEKSLQQKAEIELNNLKPGLYIIQIEQAGESAYQRILIE